ncbi:hypothetical protein BGX28_006711 [Mortierella sp. GBA30]|nr:hypothetical protein BGX28_006711 [Mortierella sp. GBA30]
MIANDAWGRLSDPDTFVEKDVASNFSGLGEDDERDRSDNDEDDKEYYSGTVGGPQDLSIGFGRLNNEGSAHVTTHFHDRDQSTESDDDEDMSGSLPELSIDFKEPETSHFEELLRWVYTGDGERWLRFFTPENYGSILENISRLNIVSSDVLDICLAFEAGTSTEQNLCGMAVAILYPETRLNTANDRVMTRSDN